MVALYYDKKITLKLCHCKSKFITLVKRANYNLHFLVL